MVIDFGYGQYVEAAGPRTEYHRRIVETRKLPGVLDAYRVTLECGHRAEAFDATSYPQGRMVLCKECQDLARE